MAKHSRIKLGSNSNPKKASTKGSGEVIEVHGSRIVRSTGRKDRHSKVCTARGTRDRRVRLSPNTAIQFYDVQDRLGYDRPSKAIDWLMKEAKSAIDALYPENGFLQSQQEDYTNSSSFFSMLNGGDHYSQLGEGLNCHSFQDLSFPFGGNGQQCLFPSALNPEPLHFPYHHHQELNYHREPLQSSFSTSSSFLLQAPLLNNHQIPSLNNYSCLRYSNNDGLLEVTASARNQGDEKEQNQSSIKPSSAASLLHFQN